MDFCTIDFLKYYLFFSVPEIHFFLITILKDFFFFDVDHFLSLYWICYNIVSVLCFAFLVMRHVES